MVESPSATGNLDITVRVLDPGKNVLYTKEREEYSDFTTRALMEGDYQVCFDNT